MLVRSWFNAAFESSVGAVTSPVGALGGILPVALVGAVGAIGAACGIGAGAPWPTGAALFGFIKNQTAAPTTITTTITHNTIFDVLDMIDNIFSDLLNYRFIIL